MARNNNTVEHMVTKRHLTGSAELSSLPTATGLIARAAYARCVEKSIKADSLLRKAGLSRQQIINPEVRLTVQSQIKFLNLVAEELGDEFLGFRLAQGFELRELGLLYYVVASSELLGDALQRLARYSVINNEGVRLSYHDGQQLMIDFAYTGVQRLPDRHQIECFVTVVIRLCRQLTGRFLRPERVTFTHLRTHVSDEIKKGFSCRVVYGGKFDRITFSKAIPRMLVRSADPYLNALLRRYCDEARSARAPGRSSLRLNVENVVVPLLPHERVSALTIARILSLSRRTLARHLMAEGLSFAGIIYELKRDLAKRYLKETGLSISTIAWLLGYSEASSFTHAFKKWTGKTPKEVRSRKEYEVVRDERMAT